jgi:hypothetical protein
MDQVSNIKNFNHWVGGSGGKMIVSISNMVFF